MIVVLKYVPFVEKRGWTQTFDLVITVSSTCSYPVEESKAGRLGLPK
jgi:hypothetical protein